jgi:hypothetical protein
MYFGALLFCNNIDRCLHGKCWPTFNYLEIVKENMCHFYPEFLSAVFCVSINIYGTAEDGRINSRKIFVWSFRNCCETTTTYTPTGQISVEHQHHISWKSPSSSPLNCYLRIQAQIRRNKFTDTQLLFQQNALVFIIKSTKYYSLYFCLCILSPHVFQPAWVIFRGRNASA